MYFVCTCENRTMKAAEIVLRRVGVKENDGGVNPIKLHRKCICKCHSEFPCTTNTCSFLKVHPWCMVES
jgi:hypothetical protein